MNTNNNNNNKQTKVQISLYASKLKNVAGAFKGTSDPYAIVTLLAGDITEQPRILGRTEVIKNTLNPAWTTTFQLAYTFGTETKFHVGVFDEIRKENKPKAMGSALFEIGECLGARGNIKAKKINSGGTIFCRVTKAAAVDYGTLNLSMRGIKLKNVDGIFSKSDPFLVVSAQTDSAAARTWFPVHRTTVKMNDLNPIWEPFQIPMDKLCDGDKSRPILIEVFDWEKSGKHQVMGKFETNVNALVRAVVMDNPSNPKAVPLTSAFTLTHKHKDFGKIVVTKAFITGENLTPKQPELASTMVQAAERNHSGGGGGGGGFGDALGPPPGQVRQQQQQRPSYTSASPLPPPIMAPQAPSQRFPPGTIPKFVDYLEGGCELNLMVAIDFTGSNGDPRIPGTLHYLHPNDEMNEYEKALTAVGSIVARYDSDQKFPVFGFGAKYNGVVQHCFQIGRASELEGVSGILEGYRQTFRTGLILSGPTVFADVIATAARQATSRQQQERRIGKQSYTILLILTDGAVTDIEQTKRAIRAASEAPLSIVIVGVGTADFSRMQFLDDFQRDEGGRTRDIVQFVEFARHRHNRRTLIKETLDEIPDQLVNYFYGKGIMPLPPISGSKLNIFEADHDSAEEMSLSMTMGPDGQLRLDDTQQAFYNGQAYGTYSSFLPPPVAPPPTPAAMAPPPPPTQYNPYQQQQQPYQQYQQQQQYHQQPQQQQQQQYHQQHNYQQQQHNYQQQARPNHGTGAPPYSYSGGAPPPQPGYGAAPAMGAGGGAAPKKFLKVGGINKINPEWKKWKANQDATAVGGGGNGARSMPAAPAAALPPPVADVPTMVYIQAPGNAQPGMQLQVQNPKTGQFQIITIPPGVPPGGMFGVNL